ncbi:hypothetical protein vseg_003548 [Gypsophila vaccaria]
MAQKHLKDLLQEDQEPFYLKDYIADKKCILLKKQAPKTTTQILLKKPKNTSFFPKNACFSSLQYSPDLRKSPLFDFTNSPVSKKSPNRVLLHVPAKTASLLLEAALKIQQKSNPKPHSKHSGFGLFGSMLKRLTLRNRAQNKLKSYNGAQVGGHNKEVLENVLSVSSVSSSSSSCCNGRSSSLDPESSSSGGSFDNEDDDDQDDQFEFSNVLLKDNNDNNNDDDGGDYGALCLSPFHFGHSSSPHIFENNQNCEQDNSVKCQLEEEDDEDKEQNSPVSVFDPPFEDDYDIHDDDCYDQQCSYAFVQRAKQQLMHKLHRFEKLAKLDPVELVKRMLDDDEEHRVVEQATTEIDKYDFESFTFANQEHSHDLLEDVVAKSGFQDINKTGIKRLISDLIIEEDQNVGNEELLLASLYKRMEQWKEVECNTIDMMVEMDLRRETSDWKKPRTHITETATDIEVAIFAVLVTELVMDIAHSAADLSGQ